MNKILKIIFINTILLLIVFLLAEFCIQFSLRTDEDFTHRFLLIKNNISIKLYQDLARKPVGLEYTDKKPIMIYGCSFAYGYNIKNNRHPGIILSELTKRPVYNYGNPGRGLQETLYILRN